MSHICVFVVVNFDTLAQASDFRIERRQVAFLYWMQDSNQGLWNWISSRLNARWQTDWAIEDQTKNLNPIARPYDQRSFSPLDPTAGWLLHMASLNPVSIGSDNGLSPARCQVVIWTNAGLLSIGLLGTNLSEFLMKIHVFLFTKMHMKISSAKWRPSCSWEVELTRIANISIID